MTSTANQSSPVSGHRSAGRLIYISLMVVGSAIGLARYGLFAEILGVDGFGHYGLVLLVLPFGVYLAHWGSLHTLNVELPIAYGRGGSGVAGIEERALGAVLITCPITLVVYGSVVLSVDFRDEDVKTALLLAGGAVFATTLGEFYILVLRVRRQLIRLGSVYFIRASAAFGLGALGAIFWGYKGAVVLDIAAAALTVCIGAAWLRIVPRRPFVAETAARITAGFPLLVMDFVLVMRYSIDRWFVATALPDEFGQYTFASLTVIGFLVVYAVLYQAFVPELLYEYGRGLSLLGLRARARRLAFAIVAGGVAGFPIVAGLSKWLSGRILEEYTRALDLVPILYVGGVASLLPLYSVVVLAARRYYLATLAAALGAAVAVVAGIIIATEQPSIRNFAWLFVISQIVSAGAAITASEWIVRKDHSPLSGH